ncbi:MAG: 4Fe-4S binding protein [Chloroflexi bacterium]|nr:4Fe-4S binding protein [Chloroflexota bacterium]
MATTAVEICGVKLRNPIMMASGAHPGTARAVQTLAHGGAAAVELKPLSYKSLPASKDIEIYHPFFKSADGTATTIIGASIGRKTVTYEEWFERELLGSLEAGIPLVANVTVPIKPSFLARNNLTEDGQVAMIVEKMVLLEEKGFSWIDLNLQTPFGGFSAGLDALLYGNWERVIREVKKAVKIPVMAKLPYLHNARDYAVRAEQAGVDGIVFGGAGRAYAVDIESGLPRIPTPGGYVSTQGPGKKAMVLANVVDAWQAVKVPIIGVAGIWTGADVIEYIMAGATCVQLYTAAVVRGFGVFRRINDEVKAWLDAHGYSSLDEIRGMAARHWGEGYAEQPKIAVDARLCDGCGECERVCANYKQAISFQWQVPVPRIDKTLCVGCGFCSVVCPRQALAIERLEWVRYPYDH